jgi:hypothetical protein
LNVLRSDKPAKLAELAESAKGADSRCMVSRDAQPIIRIRPVVITSKLPINSVLRPKQHLHHFGSARIDIFFSIVHPARAPSAGAI